MYRLCRWYRMRRNDKLFRIPVSGMEIRVVGEYEEKHKKSTPAVRNSRGAESETGPLPRFGGDRFNSVLQRRLAKKQGPCVYNFSAETIHRMHNRERLIDIPVAIAQTSGPSLLYVRGSRSSSTRGYHGRNSTSSQHQTETINVSIRISRQ